MNQQTPPSEASPVFHVAAQDGCQLRVRTLRSDATGGPPVIFIHALAMNGEMWADVGQSMPPGPALYAMDCRGHGDSDKPPGPYTTVQFANDICAVMDFLGVSQSHLVGCSMGGTVALAFAGRFPQRVASLCVIDSTACYGKESQPAWEARGQRALAEGFEAMVPFQLQRWFSPEYAEREPAGLHAAVKVFLRNHPQAYLESCRMLGFADERPGLSLYTGAASVVVGQEDYATPPEMAQTIVNGLAEADLYVLPGLRHYTPIEAPEEIAKIITLTMAKFTAAQAKEN